MLHSATDGRGSHTAACDRIVDSGSEGRRSHWPLLTRWTQPRTVAGVTRRLVTGSWTQPRRADGHWPLMTRWTHVRTVAGVTPSARDRGPASRLGRSPGRRVRCPPSRRGSPDGVTACGPRTPRPRRWATSTGTHCLGVVTARRLVRSHAKVVTPVSAGDQCPFAGGLSPSARGLSPSAGVCVRQLPVCVAGKAVDVPVVRGHVARHHSPALRPRTSSASPGTRRPLRWSPRASAPTASLLDAAAPRPPHRACSQAPDLRGLAPI
jgi:hypothetical protein